MNTLLVPWVVSAAVLEALLCIAVLLRKNDFLLFAAAVPLFCLVLAVLFGLGGRMLSIKSGSPKPFRIAAAVPAALMLLTLVITYLHERKHPSGFIFSQGAYITFFEVLAFAVPTLFVIVIEIYDCVFYKPAEQGFLLYGSRKDLYMAVIIAVFIAPAVICVSAAAKKHYDEAAELKYYEDKQAEIIEIYNAADEVLCYNDSTYYGSPLCGTPLKRNSVLIDYSTMRVVFLYENIYSSEIVRLSESGSVSGVVCNTAELCFPASELVIYAPDDSSNHISAVKIKMSDGTEYAAEIQKDEYGSCLFVGLLRQLSLGQEQRTWEQIAGD